MFVESREDNNNYKCKISIKSADGNQEVSSCVVYPNYLDCIDKEVPFANSSAFLIEFTNQCVCAEHLLFEYEVSQY